MSEVLTPKKESFMKKIKKAFDPKPPTSASYDTIPLSKMNYDPKTRTFTEPIQNDVIDKFNNGDTILVENPVDESGANQYEKWGNNELHTAEFYEKNVLPQREVHPTIKEDIEEILKEEEEERTRPVLHSAYDTEPVEEVKK